MAETAVASAVSPTVLGAHSFQASSKRSSSSACRPLQRHSASTATPELDKLAIAGSR